jgi:predicted nucleic acid-binding protein
VFLLDTNVLSELRRRDRCDVRVAAWADGIAPSQLYLSAITILEIETGTLLLARRDPASGAALRAWIDGKVLPAFYGRIVPVDTPVAQCCARLHVPDPKSERDALIAASAIVHRLRLVTRNVNHFQSMRVDLLNPWIV